MRYVFLLLILCVSFGVLDSVSRHSSSFMESAQGIAAPSFPTARQGGSGNLSHNVAPAQGAVSNNAGDAGVVTLASKYGGISALTRGLRSLVTVPAAHHHKGRAARSVPEVNNIAKSVAPQLGENNSQADAGILIPGENKNKGSAAGIGAAMNISATDAMAMPEQGSQAVAAGEIRPDLSDGNESMARTQMPDMAEQGLDRFARLAKDETAMALKASVIENSLMDPHGVQFGGIASLNWSGASASNSSGKVTGKPLTGFSLGLFADIPLKKHLSLRPKVAYSYEGYQPDVAGSHVNIHVASLNSAFNIVYNTHWMKDRFFVGAGPYVAGNINGTYTLKGINTDMTFGNNYTGGDNLRKLDYGASMMAGLLMDRNFVLGANFDLGLRNVSPDGFNTQIHTRSFSVSLMYVFRNKTIF